MLVNASKFPGPALWQGIMLIIGALWLLYIFGAFTKKDPEMHMFFRSAIGVLIIGAVLMVLIVAFY